MLISRSDSEVFAIRVAAGAKWFGLAVSAVTTGG